MSNSQITVESLYDKYGAMLYGIALEISPSSKEAEFILISTFKRISSKNLLLQNSTFWGITLMKGLIAAAQEQFSAGQVRNNFVLTRFESTPLLHELISEQKGIYNYCDANNISIGEARRKLRTEWTLLKTLDEASK